MKQYLRLALIFISLLLFSQLNSQEYKFEHLGRNQG